MHEVELLHVELGGDDLRESLDRLPLGIRGDHDGLAQRLAELDLGLGAGGAAELDRPADRLHAGLELLVDQLLAGLGEVAEVDRVRLRVGPLVHGLVQAGLPPKRRLE